MTVASSLPALRYYTPPETSKNLHLDVDVCIYGANSGGVIAAVAAKRHGLRVALINPGSRVGGLTAGGLGLTDIGNKQAIGGLSREFYRRVGAKYGLPEFWRFEPSVAEQVYLEWLEEEKIPCHHNAFLHDVRIQAGRISRLTTENGIAVDARFYIDASYEGDLMAKAGVSHTYGREGNEVYGETLNGSQCLHKHQFEHPVDPYLEEGNPVSGLLPGIDPEPHRTGQGDRRLQAYNFRLCLTNRAENRIPFSEPAAYRREDYELLARYCRAGYVPEFNKFDPLVNDKVDMNNHGAVSSDLIGGNHTFPTASYAERERLFQTHVRWIKGLLWFWASDADVPAAFQRPLQEWGWCRDEFTETGGFPHAIYIRESRRLVGDVVMTEHHCRGDEIMDDSIALAAYTMDSHNCRRIVIDGKVRNEGDVQVLPGPPYPISYRSLVPKKAECANVFVPFCLSASHIAFGSIRMEPVFMILAESCVEAIRVALEKNCDAQEVPYGILRERLLAAGQILDAVPEARDRQNGE